MNADSNELSARAEAEPTTSAAPVPMWLIAGLLLFLFVGAWYFEARGGWFEPKVYGPFLSVADLQRFRPRAGGDEEVLLKGMIQFKAYCAVCHMETGLGNPANGCPPLVGSEWVSTPSPGRMIRFVSKGMTGPITVKGQVYNTTTMLPIGDQLPGEEKDKAEVLAAILSYVRKTFGNVTVIVKPEQVQAVRAEIKDRKTPYTADEVMKEPE